MKPMARIPFNKPAFVGNEIRYLKQAVEAGQLSGDGIFTRRCNALIKDLSGAEDAMLTHSCTAALEMAAMLCGLGPGDEVLMPSFTFVSTANAVALRGATPVFVDIDPLTLNIDPAATAKMIAPQTKAIFAVHYAGFPADMDALRTIADRQEIFLVEDAAQALGSTYKGRPAGSLGDFGAFSFHETKNVISGEGGALTVNRSEFVERAEIIREKGTNRLEFLRGQVDRYTWVDLGSSFLPGELIASFLCAQLEKEPLIRARRMGLFSRYTAAFADLASQGRVRLPVSPPDCVGNGHMFYLLLRNISDRDKFIDHMNANGIVAPFHYVPLHSAPGGQKYGRFAGELRVTDEVSACLVRLPMFFELGEDVERVIDVAHAYFNSDSRENLSDMRSM